MNLQAKCVLAAVLTIVFVESRTVAAIVPQPQRAQFTQGLITGVHRGNGPAAIRVRTAGVNNQAAFAANQNGALPNMQAAQKFLVGPGTRFEASLGTNLVPASFAALRSGQRVMIESQGAQAVRVRIFPQNQNFGRSQMARAMGRPVGMRLAQSALPQMYAGPVAMPASHPAKMPHANHHLK
jgi:hypothetical protein